MNFWEGERVRLKVGEPGDVAFLVELQKDTGRNRVLGFLSPPASRAALEDWSHEQSRREHKDDDLQWLSESKTGERVGIVTHTCNPRNGTFSYALGITTQIVLPRKEGGWYHFFSTKPGDIVVEGAERLHLAPREGAVLA